MSTLSIIQTTHNVRGDMLLKGVYGMAGPVPSEGDAKRDFAVSHEFAQISLLFANLNNMPIPIGQSTMIDLDVKDEEQDDVKNQFLLALAMRWNGLYNNVGTGSDILEAMLRAEAKTVNNGIKRHFDSQAVSVWAVPVSANMSTAAYGYELNTSQDVLDALKPSTLSNLRLADNLPATALDEIPSIKAERTVANDVLEEAGTNPQWYEYDGVQADVGATFNVVARDADHARQVVIMLATNPEMLQAMLQTNALAIDVKQIISVREMHTHDRIVDAGSTEVGPADTAGATADDDSDEGDDDDDDLNPSVHFRF